MWFSKRTKKAKKANKKTLIAVPTTGSVHPSTVDSLIALTKLSHNWYAFHTVDNCVIHEARNNAVQRMFEIGCDAILFIDSDQTFPHMALDALIEEHKDMIGYPIVRKKPPYYPNISRWYPDEGVYKIVENYPQDHIFQVDTIGMGFTYIRREVFERIEKPYFDFDWVVKDGKRTDQMVGEDVYFCKKVKAAGFKIWANPLIEIGHLGMFEYLPRIYFGYDKIRKDKKEADDVKE